MSSTPEIHFSYSSHMTAVPQSITIPGWIRSCTTEVLFEGYSPYADSDEVSLPRAIVSSLNRLPIDIRSQLVDRILITGGTSNIPGLKTRISNEVKQSISSARFIKSDIADGGTISWVGGSLIGGLKIPCVYEIKRDGFINGENVPDWSRTTK
ncbi:Actin-related protein 10 [Neolecta irregularis DAH-3]|uniref:Actin-related protein 10 n=1 Tax=Neolecta irregularis (strain DAH-3) TaxID=1198029 RepID=A0A1U7LQF4_NEOID|nr:Actin-related protein 10 [Neolecta irregularis DAH-3]|eukprot:OLL24751.1 Actin-related protein 10 [Neolecta irregularis DAH-3]